MCRDILSERFIKRNPSLWLRAQRENILSHLTNTMLVFFSQLASSIAKKNIIR